MDIQGQIQEEDNPDVKQQGKQDSNQPKKRKCVCTVYKITRPGQSGIPPEILRMNSRSVEVYKKALEDGSEEQYSIRLMVVGPQGVGKTALTKRLLEEDVDIGNKESTDGIDIHVRRCRISLKTNIWMIEPDSEAPEDLTTERIVKVLRIPRKDHNGSSGGGIGETFENKDADDLRTLDDSSKEKSELPGTPGEMLNEAFVMKDDQSASEINSGVRLGQTKVEEDNPDLKHLKEVIADAKRHSSDDDYASVSIWDFGGHSVFYSTHQMFLSRRAIYILVNNMRKQIEDIDREDQPYFNCNEMQNLNIADFLGLWLYSIHGQSETDKQDEPETGKQAEPPVILVGTHADKLDSDPVNREKEIEDIFDAIRNRFDKTVVSSHFIDDKDFGLSNAKKDPKLEELRQTIIKLAKQQSYWGEVKPAKWILFEKAFGEERRKGTQIISREDLDKLNQDLPVPIADDEELDVFLRFQHAVGNIMYFSVPELNGKIVLNPQYLVDALKSLITAEEFCKKKKGLYWQDFQEKGILNTSLLDAVWNKEENKEFQDNRDHILALMEHLNIIAKPVLYAEEEESGEDTATQVMTSCVGHKLSCIFLVPCMLKKRPEEAVLLHDDAYISSPRLCLALDDVAFPSAIFNRLLAGCISRWPLAKKGTKIHIYCGCGQFDVNPQHRLTLSFSDNVIVLSITRYGEEHRHPNVRICHMVHSTVKQILERIEKILSIEIKINEHIQCPGRRKPSGLCMYSVEALKKETEFPCHEHPSALHMLKSRDMLKYWFDSEETDYNMRSDVRNQPFVLSSDMANQIPSERELASLSGLIGKEYELLAHQLEITEVRIQHIKMENQYSIDNQIFQLLWEWKKKSGQQATFSKLEKAMKAVGIDTKTVFESLK